MNEQLKIIIYLCAFFILNFFVVVNLVQADSLENIDNNDVEIVNKELLIESLQDKEYVNISVKLDLEFYSESNLSDYEIQRQRSNIENIQSKFKSSIDTLNYSSLNKFSLQPYVSLFIDQAGIYALSKIEYVEKIIKERPVRPYLNETPEIIGADIAWGNGYIGSDQTIVIIDSGVRYDHEFFQNRVIDGACFSFDAGWFGKTSSLCPNGEEKMTGSPEAGNDCGGDYSLNGCGHGTVVAGAAAGYNGYNELSDVYLNGVAKGVNIISINVFSEIDDEEICKELGHDAPCALPHRQNINNAYEYILEELVDEYDIAAVNASYGSGKYDDVCDDMSDLEQQTNYIDQIKSHGIAFIAASGNDSFKNEIAAPACLSSAISVGGTTKSNDVWSSANSAEFLDLKAPAHDINSAVAGGSNLYMDGRSGTSYAAPHVTGAFALLNEKFPQESVNEHLQRLKDTGEMIYDDRNDNEFPLIQVDKALELDAIVELQNGFVNPKSGTDEDTYTFEVTFSSTDDEPADEVTLVIDQFQEFAMKPEGDTWQQGVTYSTERDDLDPGEYEVHFEATYEDQEIRFPETGFLTLNVSIDAEGWDLAVRSADASPGIVSPDQTISVETQIVNEGEYTYTNKRVTGTLISPDGVELDDDQFVIDEIVPSRSQTYEELSLTVPSGAEDGVYDVRVEVNPERDEDPSNNISTAQVFVGEPEFTEQFIVQEYGKLVCNSDDTDPICDTYGEIIIAGNTYDIAVSGRTNNAVIHGPSGRQLFEEHEIIWWDEIQAGLVLDFVDQIPEAHTAFMHVLEMTAEGPDFDSYAEPFIKGSANELKVARGSASSFTTPGPDFFIEYNTSSDPESERNKFNDWSQGRPDVENDGQIARYPFNIPSDADSGTKRVFMQTSHENERYISQVSFKIIGTPTIAYDPEEFSADSKMDDYTSETLEIQNTGDEILNWSLEENENWISLSEESGSLSSGNEKEITVIFDAEDLEPGDYESTLQLTSNDPDQLSVSIPVDFQVNALPVSLPAKDLIAEEGNEEVTLKWEKGDDTITIMPVDEESNNDQNSADIVSYRIYRGADSDDLDLLVEVEKEDAIEIYTDTDVENDQTYYYGVRAIGEYGQESERSEIIEATPFDPEDLLAIVTGNVIGENSEPVGGVSIYVLEDEEPVNDVIADEDGVFEFQLEAGSYDIAVHGVKNRSFYTSEWIELELEEADEISVDLDVRDRMHLGVKDIQLNGAGNILQVNQGDSFHMYQSSTIWVDDEDLYMVIGKRDEPIDVVSISAEAFPGKEHELDIDVADMEASGNLYAMLTQEASEEDAKAHYKSPMLDSRVSIGFVEVLEECYLTWQLAIGVNSESEDTQTLIAGQSPNATAGMDAICGQVPMESELPDDAFHARWIIPESDDYSIVDYRSEQEAEYPAEWLMVVQPGKGEQPVELRWDNELLPDHPITLVDARTNGDQLTVDMNEENSLIIDGDVIDDFPGKFELLIQSFNPVNKQLPEPVTLQKPEDGSTVMEEPELTWTEADRAEVYTFQVAEDEGFQEVVAQDNELTETSYQLTEGQLDTGFTYYWRVKATNEAGAGDWSKVWSFTTMEEDTLITVWPGDTNNDGEVNSADVLPIGWNYGEELGEENNPGTSWEPHERQPWPADGDEPALVYADANGDGIIDARDVLVVGLNYGETPDSHDSDQVEILASKAAVSDDASASESDAEQDGELLIELLEDDHGEGRMHLAVDGGSPENYMYGLSLKMYVEADNEMALTGYELHEEASELGEDLLVFSKQPEETHFVDIALSNTEGDGFNGTGRLLELELMHEAEPGERVSIHLQDVQAVTSDGSPIALQADSVTHTIGQDMITGITPGETPDSYMLTQNYPNPFNPETQISYAVPQSEQVRLDVYDALGRHITTLVNTRQDAGYHTVSFDAGRLSSGMYVYRIVAGEFAETRTMMLVK